MSFFLFFFYDTRTAGSPSWSLTHHSFWVQFLHLYNWGIWVDLSFRSISVLAKPSSLVAGICHPTVSTQNFLSSICGNRVFSTAFDWLLQGEPVLDIEPMLFVNWQSWLLIYRNSLAFIMWTSPGKEDSIPTVPWTTEKLTSSVCLGIL